ncbi:hypothetical protein M0R72_12335 [Candidatus Pacearchaeota archaeon]|jgi:hypothetical protein|nr:hypothetical protein [Candidatus Pacearchaeota archaeon]
MAQFMQLGTFDLTDHIYGEIKPTGGGWKIKQDGATSLWTSARKDSPDGISYTFTVVFGGDTAEDDASDFLLYCAPYGPDDPDFDDDVGADIPLYIRTPDWFYTVWGVVLKPTALNKQVMDYTQYCYDVTCYLYSPYSYAFRPLTWLQSGITSLPVTKSISNRKGHIASAFDSLAVTCTYNSAHVKNLVHSIGSTSLTLATEALSDEIWELKGNENTLLERYEDPITSGTTHSRDVTGTSAYYDPWGCVVLSSGESFYYKLSGPNPARYPVKMTAAFWLNTSGDLCTVDVSSDAVSWTTVLTQADFGVLDPVAHEYALSGTEYMTDIYIRFKCTTGSPVNVCLGSIKFEVDRWVEYGAVPQIAAGQSATATVDATTGSEYCNISGNFYARRFAI